jgi:hypothetical protein
LRATLFQRPGFLGKAKDPQHFDFTNIQLHDAHLAMRPKV